MHVRTYAETLDFEAGTLESTFDTTIFGLTVRKYAYMHIYLQF